MPFFYPEMSASLTYYIVQVIYTALTWILYPLHFSLKTQEYENNKEIYKAGAAVKHISL